MELNQLRTQIEQLDHQLLTTIEHRFAIAKQIAAIKGKESIYDETREHALLEQWLAHKLDGNFIRALFHLILNESRNLMIRKWL